MEIHIQIKLEGSSFPTRRELELRDDLEEALIANDLDVVDAGAGMGVMDLFVEVDELDSAMKEVQTLIQDRGIQSITQVTVSE